MGEEHLTVERTVETRLDRVVCTETWQGGYEECLAVQKQHMPSYPDQCPDISSVWPTQAKVAPAVFCASARTVRRPGNRGVCTIVYLALYNMTVIGLELSEVVKDIRTWKADEKNEDDRPDLDKLHQWEKQKDEDWEAYENYRYDGTNELAGNTKKLAEMIYAGIESYTDYAPVISTTMSYYAQNFPDGAPDVGSQLGRRVTPELPPSYTIAGGISELPTSLKDVWIATADRATTNNDGTITRVQQWTGFDSVNEDLYPKEDPKGR